MSDDEILTAAQQRLERRRAAMQPGDRHHIESCTWLRDREKPDPNCWECSPFTDVERERIITNVLREIRKGDEVVYQVGDRVVYKQHVSDGPSGTSGSMSVDFTMQGTVMSLKPSLKQMQVRWECPQPVGVVMTMVRMNDPAVSKVAS